MGYGPLCRGRPENAVYKREALDGNNHRLRALGDPNLTWICQRHDGVHCFSGHLASRKFREFPVLAGFLLSPGL